MNRTLSHSRHRSIKRRPAPATALRRVCIERPQVRRFIAPAGPCAFSENNSSGREPGHDGRPGHDPARATSAHESLPLPVLAPMPAAGTGLRVLLAEDDPMVARSTVAVLRRLGHTVAHALDGVAAWRHIETRLHDFDVLLLDVIMPRMSGSELARRARTAGFTGQIVLVSGLIMEIDPDALRLLGIRKFMTKPFLPSDLERALRGES